VNGLDKEKVGVRFQPANTARARAAYLHTVAEEGHASFSEFIEAALNRLTAYLDELDEG
jgi:hypothetical protein